MVFAVEGGLALVVTADTAPGTPTPAEFGTVCEVGSTSPTAPRPFSGVFYNTGGTGRFADATGGGTVTGGGDGYWNSFDSEIGNIGY